MTEPMAAAARTSLLTAFFLPSTAEHTGQRFCLFHAPQGNALRGRVLYLHPFAEELNTTRRTVAQQARALARAGFAVLQIDLHGCGDSSGDFAEATWSAWLGDAAQGYHWLSQNVNASASGPAWVWGMRSGALLAAELVQQLQNTAQEPINLLFWQPVASGQQMLQQFLRLHSASQWLGNGGDNSNHGPSPAQRLAQGESVAIAGYTLSPALAQGLGAARLQLPTSATPARLVWLDLSSQTAPTQSPATAAALATWRAAGWQIHADTVTSPAFWQTVDIDAAPALLHATQQALSAAAPCPVAA